MQAKTTETIFHDLLMDLSERNPLDIQVINYFLKLDS